jgi:hypothetical protein
MSTRIHEKHSRAATGNPGGHFRKVGALAVLLIVLWPYAASFGDQGAVFTLANRTKHFLHAMINNNPYVYIAPGRVVTYQSGALSSVVVEVTYSPGQSITGKASKTLVPVRQETATGSNNCNNTNSNCHSTTGYSSSVSPMSWDITPADLESH